jgi:hypothetical protein
MLALRLNAKLRPLKLKRSQHLSLLLLCAGRSEPLNGREPLEEVAAKHGRVWRWDWDIEVSHKESALNVPA